MTEDRVWWFMGPEERAARPHRDVSIMAPHFRRPVIHSRLVHNSLAQGTFTKTGAVLGASYGVNRATRRKMARALDLPWIKFNWMFLRKPKMMTDIYLGRLQQKLGAA